MAPIGLRAPRREAVTTSWPLPRAIFSQFFLCEPAWSPKGGANSQTFLQSPSLSLLDTSRHPRNGRYRCKEDKVSNKVAIFPLSALCMMRGLLESEPPIVFTICSNSLQRAADASDLAKRTQPKFIRWQNTLVRPHTLCIGAWVSLPWGCNPWTIAIRGCGPSKAGAGMAYRGG